MGAQSNGRFLDITIDDNGPGIPESQREEVFRPFYRLDVSRNLETGGVGLGLSIARDGIRNHGGKIRLGDSPYGGLRVHIRLPQ
jgi:two-component system osmolarity sensor histidine kinase EnvZ